jgi:hypothetical protein
LFTLLFFRTILFLLYSLLEKPVLYQDSNQTLLKKALKDAEAESVLKSVARMDVEIQRATKFLQISTDLRQLQKRADVCFLLN